MIHANFIFFVLCSKTFIFISNIVFIFFISYFLIFYVQCILYKITWATNTSEPSWWSWSYGSWIYNYLCNQCLTPLLLWFRFPLRRGVLDTTLCVNVCKWLAAGRWFSPDTLVNSTNKTDRHNITEILLKYHNP